MTAALKPGDKVRVHIGGKDFDPDGFDGAFVDRSEYNVDVELHDEIVTFPATWVERIPPRWTEPAEPNTYIKVTREDSIRFYLRTHSRDICHWMNIQSQASLDWADITDAADDVSLATFTSLRSVATR